MLAIVPHLFVNYLRMIKWSQSNRRMHVFYYYCDVFYRGGKCSRACVCTTHVAMHNASDIATSACMRLWFCDSSPLVNTQLPSNGLVWLCERATSWTHWQRYCDMLSCSWLPSQARARSLLLSYLSSLLSITLDLTSSFLAFLPGFSISSATLWFSSVELWSLEHAQIHYN
jgi:hypothetical protein